MTVNKIISIILVSTLILSACSKSAKKSKFSDDSSAPAPFPTLVDSDSKVKIETSKELKFNQTAIITYKTMSPGGTGIVEYKAKKLVEIPKAGEITPAEGKKLVLLDFSYKGSDKNKGKPSIINEIGQTPAPQFVILDAASNTSIVESTEYSDAYAQSKKLFELYKLTLDNNKVVDTSLVFEIDKNLSPDLAIRFTNKDGKTEFYAVR